MTQRRFRSSLVIVAVALFAPATAFAAPGAGASKTPVPPSSGHWVLNNDDVSAGIVEVSGGSFTVTSHHRAVAKLTATIGPDAETACGTGIITVFGSHRIYDAKGTVAESDTSYSVWHVGTNNSSGAHAEKVTLGRHGKHFKGELSMTFIGRHGGKQTNKLGGVSGGEISFPNHAFGSGCELDLGYQHH